MTLREVAFENEILRGVVGSTTHGTAIEGSDDRDEMGVFVEPPEHVCGLTSCDHYIYRDAAKGERSKPGDLDLTIYSLRKFCRLAAKGNPSILLLLWLPKYVTKTGLGYDLINIRKAFIGKEAGKSFLGYLIRQKKSFTGELSQKVNRPDLISKYGYDTKFAMHALRLGYQGIELVCNKQITLPVPEPELSTLRAVRRGEFTYAEVLKLIEDAEGELRIQVKGFDLEPDIDLINKTMVDIHMSHWDRTYMKY